MQRRPPFRKVGATPLPPHILTPDSRRLWLGACLTISYQAR